ncbi:MAG TPA: ANTAR domain-containing protein [Bryobacteraceae bacterium]|nr:ANTAR domain-containing protein [Bryobacteraceae bacterium]
MTSTGEDRQDPLAASTGQDFSVILRTAKELTANSVVVLFLGGGRIEATYLWSENGNADVAAPAAISGGPELHQILSRGGALQAGTAAACALRAAVAPAANSFLLFTRQIRKCTVVMAFGFAARQPPHASIPPAAAERLDLVAFATWSSRQLDRLQTELQVVNQKLASRKLVERAKALLQTELQIDERQAYEHLRKTSRQRRITIAKLAEEVLRRPAAELGTQSKPECPKPECPKPDCPKPD